MPACSPKPFHILDLDLNLYLDRFSFLFVPLTPYWPDLSGSEVGILCKKSQVDVDLYLDLEFWIYPYRGI